MEEEELDDEACARLHDEAERESMAQYTALINEMRSCGNGNGKPSQAQSLNSARTRSVSASVSKSAKPSSSVEARPSPPRAPAEREHNGAESGPPPEVQTATPKIEPDPPATEQPATAAGSTHETAAQSPVCKNVPVQELETGTCSSTSTPTPAATSGSGSHAERDGCPLQEAGLKSSKDASKDVPGTKPPDVAKRGGARGKMVRTLEYVLADEPGFELRQFPLRPAEVERMRAEDEEARALLADARQSGLLSLAVPFPWLLEGEGEEGAESNSAPLSTRELLARTLPEEERSARLHKYLESRRKLVACM